MCAKLANAITLSACRQFSSWPRVISSGLSSFVGDKGVSGRWAAGAGRQPDGTRHGPSTHARLESPLEKKRSGRAGLGKGGGIDGVHQLPQGALP